MPLPRKNTQIAAGWFIPPCQIPGIPLESTRKEAPALLFQLSSPQVPANYYYKSKGSAGRQKLSKKITMQRFLSEDKQQGSQRLQKRGADGLSVHHSRNNPLQKKGCKADEGSSELWEGGGQSLPQNYYWPQNYNLPPISRRISHLAWTLDTSPSPVFSCWDTSSPSLTCLAGRLASLTSV